MSARTCRQQRGNVLTQLYNYTTTQPYNYTISHVCEYTSRRQRGTVLTQLYNYTIGHVCEGDCGDCTETGT